MRSICRVILLNVFIGGILFAQTGGFFEIASSTSIHMIITDPIGRRTGGDPRGVHADTAYGITWLREIPEANYSFESIGSESDSGDNDSIDNMKFMYSPRIPDDCGMYTIQAIGTKADSFWIDASIRRSFSQSDSSWGLQVTGLIDKDSVVTFRLAFLAPDTSRATLVKVVDMQSLFLDIALSKKLGFCSNETLMSKYASFLDEARSSLAHGELLHARNRLSLMSSSLARESDANFKRIARDVLQEDTRLLLVQLDKSLSVARDRKAR